MRRRDIFLSFGNTASKGGETVEGFSCKTKIISGSGSIGAIREFGSQRLMVVSDPFFVQNGVAQKIAALSSADQTNIFSGVTPDPTVEQVAEATAGMKSFRPDTVLALGGGSAMDCAKAMVFFSGLSVRFVAVPTTSGSGSEVTDFAILTHNGVKHPLIDQRLCPDIAILDSDFLTQLPAKLIADTGFDVIAHAMEGYVAKNAGAFTDALAADAFVNAMDGLLRSYRGDCSVRGQLHEASCMAGMAFTKAGLGLCHAMSHTLGGVFHIPHGRLNAILLPTVIGVNSQAVGAKYAILARRAGLGGAADSLAIRNLTNALVKLRKALNLPGTLVEAGVEIGKLRQVTEQLVKTTLADPCCQTNPVTVTDEMVRRVLKEVTGSA